MIGSTTSLNTTQTKHKNRSSLAINTTGLTLSSKLRPWKNSLIKRASSKLSSSRLTAAFSRTSISSSSSSTLTASHIDNDNADPLRSPSASASSTASLVLARTPSGSFSKATSLATPISSFNERLRSRLHRKTISVTPSTLPPPLSTSSSPPPPSSPPLGPTAAMPAKTRSSNILITASATAAKGRRSVATTTTSLLAAAGPAVDNTGKMQKSVHSTPSSSSSSLVKVEHPLQSSDASDENTPVRHRTRLTSIDARLSSIDESLSKGPKDKKASRVHWRLGQLSRIPLHRLDSNALASGHRLSLDLPFEIPTVAQVSSPRCTSRNSFNSPFAETGSSDSHFGTAPSAAAASMPTAMRDTDSRRRPTVHSVAWLSPSPASLSSSTLIAPRPPRQRAMSIFQITSRRHHGNSDSAGVAVPRNSVVGLPTRSSGGPIRTSLISSHNSAAAVNTGADEGDNSNSVASIAGPDLLSPPPSTSTRQSCTASSHPAPSLVASPLKSSRRNSALIRQQAASPYTRPHGTNAPIKSPSSGGPRQRRSTFGASDGFQTNPPIASTVGGSAIPSPESSPTLNGHRDIPSSPSAMDIEAVTTVGASDNMAMDITPELLDFSRALPIPAHLINHAARKGRRHGYPPAARNNRVSLVAVSSPAYPLDKD